MFTINELRGVTSNLHTSLEDVVHDILAQTDYAPTRYVIYFSTWCKPTREFIELESVALQAVRESFYICITVK